MILIVCIPLQITIKLMMDPLTFDSNAPNPNFNVCLGKAAVCYKTVKSELYCVVDPHIYE